MLIFLIILGIILVSADQLIKIWITNNLKPVNVMDFIRFGDVEILGLRYCENTGAAFSSLSGKKWLLIVLVSAMLVGLLVFTVRYERKHPLFLVSSVMVMSGGVGNLIDRVRLGYVIDYLDVKLFNFAVFNFADICVVLGAVFMLLYLFFIDKPDKGKANEQA